MRALQFVTRRIRSDFVRHVGTYATGVTFSQVLAVGLTPVLSRIYQPEMFGALGVFSSIIAICSVVITLRYEQAILLPETDREATMLLMVAMAFATAFSILSMSVLLLLTWMMPGFSFFDADWKNLMFWLPLGGLLGAYNACLMEWLVRKRAFYAITQATIVQAFTNAGIALCMAFLGPKFSRYGLVTALVLSLVTGTMVLVFAALKTFSLKEFSVSGMAASIVRYRGFLYFSLSGDTINSLATQLPLLVVSRLFNLTAAGNFSMALRLLYLPSRFIGKAVRDVFRQRAAQDARGSEGCRRIFMKSSRAMAVISALVMLPALLFGPQIFAIALGEKWRMAGEMARLLSPMIGLSFVASPMGWLLFLYEKQHIDLLWQVGLLSSCAIAAAVGYYTGNILIMVGAWSFGGCLLYLFYLGISYKLSGLQLQDPIENTPR